MYQLRFQISRIPNCNGKKVISLEMTKHNCHSVTSILKLISDQNVLWSVELRVVYIPTVIINE